MRRPGDTAGGSVLDVGIPFPWATAAVMMPTVIHDGSRYRMWFEGGRQLLPGESPYLYNGSIGAATSTDGVNWFPENGGLPVLLPSSGAGFDRHAVSHPFVMRRGGGYVMWYGGVDGSQAANDVRIERIGMAVSSDGITWSKANGGRPVVDLGPTGTPDTIQATGPCVVEAGGKLMMWYGAYDGRHTIMLAVSEDGIAWEKLGVVNGLGGGDDTEALGPSVWWDGSAFVMFYSRRVENEWRMFAATSADGMSWSPARGDQPVLPSPAPSSFDSAGPGRNHSVHPSQLVFTTGRILMWYTGEDAGRNHEMRIGLAECLLTSRHRAIRRR